MIPKNGLYKFVADEAENLVMLRVGGGVRTATGLNDLTPFGTPKDVVQKTSFADGEVKVGNAAKNGETAKVRIYARASPSRRIDSAERDSLEDHHAGNYPLTREIRRHVRGAGADVPRRNVVGVELSDAQVAAMPKMISTDAHVMEPDALWQELTPRLREHLPKVPFRNNPPGATDPHLRLRDQDTDGVPPKFPVPNYGMALFGIDDIETQQESFKLYNDGCTILRGRSQAAVRRAAGVRLRHQGRHQGDAARFIQWA